MLVKSCVHEKIEEIRMKISIKNVGRVYDASICMKGITVIGGLNNTGKSTILKSIYASLNTFRNIDEKIAFERKRSVETVIGKMENHFDKNGYNSLPQEVLRDLAELVDRHSAFFTKDPGDFRLFFRLYSDYIKGYSELIEAIGNDFIYTEEFARPIFEKIEEVFSRTKEHYMKYIGDLYFRNTFNGQVNNEQNKMSAQIILDTDSEEKKILVCESKIETIEGNGGNAPDAIYIPAFNMLDMINSGRGIRLRYSAEGELKKYLSETNDEEQSYEEYHEIEDNTRLIKEILEEVIHGRLERTVVGEFRFKENEMDNSISLSNIASGLKNFLIIQSLVESGKLKRNGILLIDEPETNLHPEWQLIFAEILALMCKHMGVITVVNSHSPYFIRALEVKLADHGMKDAGAFYLMKEEKKNLFTTEDVTQHTGEIYDLLYKPLEYL